MNGGTIFQIMMYVIIFGIPIILLRYFICTCKKDKYLEKSMRLGHVVKGVKISQKHTFITNVNRDVPDDGEKVTYEYEYNGKKYKKNIVYSWDVAKHEFPEEVELYFLKNPKKAAKNAKELAEMQVHPVMIIFVICIIGFALQF